MLPPGRKPVIVACACLVLCGVSGPAAAVVTFYFDESAWQTAWEGVAGAPPPSRTVAFDTDAAGVLLANQVTALPGPNTLYPDGVLRWDPASTGLCRSFVLRTLEPGAALTFDDNEGAAQFDEALSIGDINNHDNDDFEVVFVGAPVLAFGFYLVDNTAESGELLRVDTTAGTAQETSLPGSAGGAVFMGVVSDDPITRVFFDEHSGGDDIAVQHFRFDDATAVDSDSDTIANCTDFVAVRDAEVAAGGASELSNGGGTRRIVDARLGRTATPTLPEPSGLGSLGAGMALLLAIARRRASQGDLR